MVIGDELLSSLVRQRDILVTRWFLLGSLTSRVFTGSENSFSALCPRHWWFCFCPFSLVAMDLMFPSHLLCSS